MNEIRSTPLALMVVAWLAAFGIPGSGAPGAMARETQVGGDADGWRIVHRQADAQTTKQAPQ
jgi:hypothetical protein